CIHSEFMNDSRSSTATSTDGAFRIRTLTNKIENSIRRGNRVREECERIEITEDPPSPLGASSARRGMRGLPRAKSEGHEGGVRAGAGRNDHELPARFRFVRHGSGANWKRGRHARQFPASRLVESV